jgi:hypothetical protein
MVSGVGLSFIALLATGECELNDYPDDVLDGIVIPDLSIHKLHKH